MQYGIIREWDNKILYISDKLTTGAQEMVWARDICLNMMLGKDNGLTPIFINMPQTIGQGIVSANVYLTTDDGEVIGLGNFPSKLAHIDEEAFVIAANVKAQIAEFCFKMMQLEPNSRYQQLHSIESGEKWFEIAQYYIKNRHKNLSGMRIKSLSHEEVEQFNRDKKQNDDKIKNTHSANRTRR